MTDRTDLLRGTRAWQAVLAGGVAVFTAASITAFVGVGDPASADTYLTSVTRAVVALPDGSEREARIGDLLPQGARLRTGEGGGAQLTTDDRDVYVGALSTVQVLDGVRETLERGQVMVDSRRGPPLTLGTKAGTVTTPQGALVRVEQGVVQRVGVFDGAATLAVADRQATTTVPALYQATTQYGALPGRPTALVLTHDPWEQRLALNLTSADSQLLRLQSGLRGADGILVLAAAPVALRAAALDPDRGEQALSIAVAEVAEAADSAATNLTTVRTARGEGGSWGVVAAIVRASVTEVSLRLQEAFGPDPDGPLLAGPAPDQPGLLGPAPSPTPGPSAVPTVSPRPTPTPTPTVSPPSPTSPPTTVVDQVITVVSSLVPTPLPSLAIVIGPLEIGLG